MSYTISPDVYTSTSGVKATTATGSSTDDNGAASITSNYSTFLNLLTAQIKNQDPLSPMDTTQWTNQLVQYSSVEQQLKANQYLQTIANAGASGSLNTAVGYIGKTVTAQQDTSTLANGSANWNYTLGATASKTVLSVVNADGTTVWSGSPSDMTKGDHTFTWDGKDSAGKAVADGDYTLKISATTSAGATVDTTIGVSGTVTSAENVSGSVVLKVGNTSVPVANITSVS